MLVLLCACTCVLLTSETDSLYTTVYHMLETGWVKVSSTDVGQLHYQYLEEKQKPPS